MSETIKQNCFYVCYAQKDEELAKSVMKQITDDLEIKHELWSYSTVVDINSYFENTVSSAIEETDFVLFLLTKSCDNDILYEKTYTMCVNLNKRMIPVKISSGLWRLKRFKFRTEIYDYNSKTENVKLLETLHSRLGLAVVYPWSDVKFCSDCGRVIKTKAAFCRWCGKHFVENATRHCRKCGNPVKTDAVFCNICGTKL